MSFEVRVAATAAEATQWALAEVQAHLAREPDGLVSFATGRTFAPFFAALSPFADRLRGTHLDEFVGLSADSPHGMAAELFAACPGLRRAWREGRFWPVPGTDKLDDLRAHEAALAAAGGVALQLLGLGRNGHLAFNEPGTPFDSRFHVAELTPQTRADLVERFQPASVPTRAATAGLASILAARRVVLVATGGAKRPAVERLLSGEVSPELPASVLHRHPNALVILEAAARLSGPTSAAK